MAATGRYARPFIADETRLTRTMAAGHLARTGHALAGTWLTTYAMPGMPVQSLVRSCCTSHGR